MQTAFSVYFTQNELADMKEQLKDSTLSLSSLEFKEDSKLVLSIVHFRSDSDFQTFCNAMIRTGVNQVLNSKPIL
jgi:hypothetical protein